MKEKEITLIEYQEAALRTAKDMGSLQQNLIHAALGITSEAGEISSIIKAACVYNKEIDIAHLIEEAGDCLWFLALAAKCSGVSLEDIARDNIRKLRTRFPSGYSDLDAQMRWDKVTEVSPYSRLVLIVNEEEEDRVSIEDALLPLTYILPSAKEDEDYDAAQRGEIEK